MTKKNSILRAQSRGDSGFARVLTIVAMMLLFLTTGATSAMADPVEGDVNGDDVCDIADVAAVISVMGGDNTYAATADVNVNGSVDVADIAQIYSLMAQQSGTSTGTKVVLTANDITVANGNEVELTIMMDYETEQTITGVAFSLYLPDGILLKGFDTKEAQDVARASALKKACDLGEDGVWGEDATSSWLSVKQKDDGGLLFVFIDQDDKTAFESTKAPLITIKVHAVADVANATASIKNISITSDQNASIDRGAIADVTFGINKAAVPEEPAVEAGTVTLADGTEDADKWQGKAGEGEYQALPLEGVAAGTAVSVKYTGTRRVKSVKAVIEGASLIVNPEVGQIIGSDGKNYDANATLPNGVTAVAMIAYVGGDAETSTTYNHGLALALENVSGTKAWCSQTSATCLGTQYSYAGTQFNDLAGIDNTDALVNHTGHTHAAANAARGYNNGTHPAGTSAWFLPSAGQWDKMATAAGSYANLKTNAGLQSAAYWSSTERGYFNAWVFDSSQGTWYSYYKDVNSQVRACLAF